MMKIKKVSKSFGGVKALDKCSISIKKNDITAIIGPNGCGKSTLFNVINKLEIQDEGKIFLDKKDISSAKPYEVARKGVSRTFQYPTLFENLTIRDHIEMALMQDDEYVIKSLFGRNENKNREQNRKQDGEQNREKNKEQDERQDYDKKIKSVLELVGLKKDSSTLGSNLSYGQRKLLDLAIAIAKPHELILLDEPVAGINPGLREEIKKIIRLLKKKGETIVLIEHDMNFVMELADEIFVMDEGKVLVSGSPNNIRNNPKVLEAYLGD